MATIKDLKFDDKNFNKHTEFGMGLLEKSLRENGAGRSILLDKDNNIIAGNGVVETAGNIGLEKVRIVETSGDEIIAVKRTDISLDSEQGRQMALADNATASADLEWDADTMREELDDDIIKAYGIELEDEKELEEENEKPELDFTEILDEDSQYIVLKFNSKVDWLQAQSLFGIETKKDYYTSTGHTRQQIGLGRVIDGTDALNRLGAL